VCVGEPTTVKNVLHNSQIRSEVAVIVPCYNAKRYLQRALDSVFAQTYQDFCVYVVDDGSTDGTSQVLETFTHRCVSMARPHAGQAAARNHGILASSAPFIAFLDADDEWLPKKLESQIALLKKDPSLGLVCSLCRLSEVGNARLTILSADDVPSSGRLFQQLVRSCFVFTPTVIVRRRCLEEVGLFNESLAVSEDFNLWLRIAARWKIAFMPEALAINHKRPGSLSVSISTEERLRQGVAALEHVRSSCPELSPSEAQALRRALAERFYFHGSFLLSTGAKGPSRGKLASTLRLQPTHWRALAKLGLSLLPTGVSKALIESTRQFDYRSPSKTLSEFALRAKRALD
jgi:Glycosyl transferase family 2